MNVMAEFVIEHLSEMNFAENGNPEACFRRIVEERLVDANFDPRWLALPRVVVEPSYSRFVNLAFARSYFPHLVPARKASLIEKNHAIESNKVLLRDRVQKSADHLGGIKGRLVVAIGFDDTGLRIGHGKSLDANAHLRRAESVGDGKDEGRRDAPLGFCLVAEAL